MTDGIEGIGRRCAYCPEPATHTVIGAAGQQIDVCVPDAAKAIDGLLTPPRVLSLAQETERMVIVNWSWVP